MRTTSVANTNAPGDGSKHTAVPHSVVACHPQAIERPEHEREPDVEGREVDLLVGQVADHRPHGIEADAHHQRDEHPGRRGEGCLGAQTIARRMPKVRHRPRQRRQAHQQDGRAERPVQTIEDDVVHAATLVHDGSRVVGGLGTISCRPQG